MLLASCSSVRWFKVRLVRGSAAAVASRSSPVKKSPSTAPSDHPAPAAVQPGSGDRTEVLYVRRHLLIGWWALFLFVLLGLALEMLHGFKVPAYLNATNTTRRLMWTLAHAHGTLLALIHLAFAAAVKLMPAWEARRRDFASNCLVAASVLVPSGFFAGGIWIYGGDPGLGVLLVPIGAVLLLVSLFLAGSSARAAVGAGTPERRGAR